MRTERTRALPPFFTQVIGSLPRPKFVRDLIDRRDSMPPDDFGRLMDEMVIVAIRLQELAGLDVISDGEAMARGDEVVVVEIAGNRVVVSAHNS